jgi:hypothetical protein
VPDAAPTPAGVPVKMRSPTSRVRIDDRYEIRWATGKIRFVVRPVVTG